MATKKGQTKREIRNLRMQQIMFVMIGLMVILSMVIGLVAK
jgi:hypothetical protein